LGTRLQGEAFSLAVAALKGPPYSVTAVCRVGLQRDSRDL